MSKSAAMSLAVVQAQLNGELNQLSPDTLHYVKHGIASEGELALVARICERSMALLELLPQVVNKPQ
ncbi:hypothetical protein G6Z94_11690 [Vibrio aestuarianus]|uniref:hypothetical protein n=1 Tax=Vibrio aestuarianus TaxID=28171 RepID=UPI001594BC55|nr:hypothetical protein [Vibrio aestuarianus]NGZ18001.1 hypothetical protein [Vibrio aestuarianus]